MGLAKFLGKKLFIASSLIGCLCTINIYSEIFVYFHSYAKLKRKIPPKKPFHVIVWMLETVYHSAFTCSKWTMITPEESVRSVQG